MCQATLVHAVYVRRPSLDLSARLLRTASAYLTPVTMAARARSRQMCRFSAAAAPVISMVSCATSSITLLSEVLAGTSPHLQKWR